MDGLTITDEAYAIDNFFLTPQLKLVDFADSGSSATDRITSDNTFSLALSGQEAGSSVVFQRSTNGGTTWSTTTASQSSLADGNYQIRAQVTDVAGNSAFSNVQSVTVDTKVVDSFNSADGWINGSINSSSSYYGSVLGFYANGIKSNGQDTWKVFDLGDQAAALSFDLARIDTWDNESFRVYINDQIAFERAFLGWQAISSASGSTNGFSWSIAPKDDISFYAGQNVPDLDWTLDQTATITISIPAGLATAKIGFGSTLDGLTITDEAYAIDNFFLKPQLKLVDFADSGSSATDRITRDNTFSLALIDQEAGSTVVFQRSADAGATWSTTTAVQSSLADGNYQFRAQVTDVAGNSSFSIVQAVSVDISAIPGNLALGTDFADSGFIASDHITIDNSFSLVLSGQETGGTVAYQRSTDDGTTWGSTTASISSLADGNYQFRAQVTDIAGNSAFSNVQPVSVDTTPPSSKAVISGVGDDVGMIQGIVAASGATDDSTPTISGTLSAALGTGERLQIFNGTTVLGDATVNNTALSWTFRPAGLANTAATTYTLTAKVVDLAGNFGSASASRVFVLDTIAPLSSAAITSVTDNVGGIQGALAAGAVTDDSTPSLSGTITAALATGESLRIFNGSALLGAAVVNNTLKTWTFTPTALPATSGTPYAISARVADAAGNLGTPSASISFSLDTTPPSSKAVISGVGDDVGMIQGIVAASGATDDSTPTISGTLSAALGTGERLQIFNGTTVLGDATVNNTALSWTFRPAGLANTAATTYTLTAKVVDLAGNFGSASASRVFVLDTIAPLSSAAITSVTDNVGGIQGALAAGAVTDDSTPSLSGTITAALATGESLRIFNGSALLGAAVVNNTLKTWTFTPTALPATSGTPYAISARVADAAGNLGTPSASVSFSLDTISNQVNGDANANTLTATNAKDLLTGLGGTDTFSFPSLALSLFPSVDRITDFAIGTDSLKGPTGMTPSKIANLGAVTNLDATAITALLSSSVFMANSAAAFTSLDPEGMPRTYVALNDGIDGFSPTSDALIEITGYSGSLDYLLLS